MLQNRNASLGASEGHGRRERGTEEENSKSIATRLTHHKLLDIFQREGAGQIWKSICPA
jgi:hypothetical protein